jgi:hypothetical protein
MCATFVIDVDDVIGRIEYVRRFKVDTVALLRKLIVGGAGDDLGFQAWQGFVVDDGAERGGHEYFGQRIVNLIGRGTCVAAKVRWVTLLRLLWISLTNRTGPASLRLGAKCQPTFRIPCTATRTHFKSSCPKRSRIDARRPTLWRARGTVR